MRKRFLNRRKNKLAPSYHQLEARQLLAKITADAGVLTIVGTAGQDRIRVSESTTAANMIAVRDGIQETNIDVSSINRVEFFGLEGDDEFLFSNSNQFQQLSELFFSGAEGNDSLYVDSFRPGASFSVEGIGGTGDDILEIANALQITTATPAEFFGLSLIHI